MRPIGLPLTEAWAMRAMGRWDDARATVPVAIYFGALLLLLWEATGRGGGALLFTALAATSPMVLMMALLGMADLPLAALLLAALLCVERWTADGGGGRGYLRCAGALIACMCWTKREGAMLSLLVLDLAALGVLGTRMLRRERVAALVIRWRSRRWASARCGS